MKQVRFGSGSAPAVIAGMMRIDGRTDAQIRELYDAARANGIDFFDHA
ncbi:MAG: aldo/keto reductase family oxidoreductase, partial [Actinobacteria bacterium]|nr:aldo/keto reductase family oxidoreductase [Actinomycetota bacterium]